MFSFISRYGNPSKGITGMSNRVILNGGLSALRWNRTSVSEPATLNLVSSGLGSNNQVSASFLKSLPPKVNTWSYFLFCLDFCCIFGFYDH